MPKYTFTKNSNLERPRNIPQEYYISASYGTKFEYEPVDVPLRIYHFSGSITGSDQYNVFRSLKNTINYYNGHDELFNFDNFYNKSICLMSLSSLHLGSGIERGSVELSSCLSGSYLSKCSDFREDGVLYDSSDEKIGVVLYKEGFIILNNTSSLSDTICGFYNGTNFNDNPRWIHMPINSSSALQFDFSYRTKNEVPTSTYFVFANKNELNHSNNSTYIQSGSIDGYWSSDNSYLFVESPIMKIKNTVKSPFLSGSANFEKQTFITKIGLYDKNKIPIGYAALANPVRKTEDREFLFKLKLDF